MREQQNPIAQHTISTEEELERENLLLYDNQNRSLYDAYLYASRTAHPKFVPIMKKLNEQWKIIEELFHINERANYTLLPELFELGAEIPRRYSLRFMIGTVSLAKFAPERHPLLAKIAELEEYRFLVGNSWWEKKERAAREKFFGTHFEFIFDLFRGMRQFYTALRLFF